MPTSSDPTGVFAKGVGEPTFAGALAIPEIGVAGASEPVLYVHPRFTGRLPASLLTLEQRHLEKLGSRRSLVTLRDVRDHLGGTVMHGLPRAS